MAELTQLEDKVGEIIGLARASQDVTSKVAGLVEDDEVKSTLQQMGQDAKEIEQRAMDAAGQLDGKKTAIDEKARETKSEATEMMKTYLGDDADALDGIEFLIMAEAGELGHAEIANKMSEQVSNQGLREVIQYSVEVERRHWDWTREAALKLAAQEDATAVAG